MNRIYVIYSGSAATIYHRSLFRQSRIQSYVRRWIVKGRESQILYSSIISLLPYGSWKYGEIFFRKTRKEEESETLSLSLSSFHFLISEKVDESLINDSADSASDTLRPPGRDIRREKQRGQQHLPPSLCPSLFLALLQTRRTVDRVYPLHAVVDSKLKFHPHARSRTHTCPFCFLVSLSLFFSPLSFSFSFFFFFNFVHSILDTGRGEDMRVPPCRDIGLFSKSSPPPPTAAILSNMKFLTSRVRVFDHAPPG